MKLFILVAFVSIIFPLHASAESSGTSANGGEIDSSLSPRLAGVSAVPEGIPDLTDELIIAQATDAPTTTATLSETATAAKIPNESSDPMPFGASVTLSNVVGWGTFVPGEFNKRPQYDVELGVSPHYDFMPNLRLLLDMSISKSVITNADSSVSYAGQTLLSDLLLRLAYTGIVQEPVTGLKLNAAVDLIFPTSLSSQFATLYTVARASVGLSGKWGWFGASYSFRFAKYFHEFDHASLEKTGAQNIALCINRDDADADRCFPGGNANPSFQFNNSLRLTAAPLEQLTFFVAFAVSNTFTYNVNPDDEFTSPNAVPGRGQRDSMTGEFGVSYQVNDYLDLELSATTQQPPKTYDNSSFRFPFFAATADNFTSISFDVTASF
ncbi:MAG: hypothetical protein HUU55_02165 [Myxococcales bacterium]|nr:hypothetical protein [Myxococcales bacterium]